MKTKLQDIEKNKKYIDLSETDCEDCEGTGIVEKTGYEPDDIIEVKCHCRLAREQENKDDINLMVSLGK